MLREPLVFELTDTDVLTAPPVCGLVTIPDLLQHVQRWCTGLGDTLVVDLSRVDVLDLAVFRALWWAREYCDARGRELVIVKPADSVLRGHEVSLLLGLLRSYPDVVSARAAQAAQAARAARAAAPEALLPA